MPQKQDTPSMKAVKSVGPSIKSIGEALGTPKRKKRELAPTDDERSIFNPKKIYDDVVGGLKGLKYLNPKNRPR